MNPTRPLLFAALLMSAPSLWADAVSDAIQAAAKQPPKQALATLQSVASTGANRPELTAELALAWSDLADTQKGKEAKASATRSLELAEEALKAGPKLARAHLAVAVACGKMTDFVDNSTKMNLSRRIQQAALKAVELDPKSALGYEILGRWEYGFATLNPFLKAAARVAYGKLPDASLANAAGYLEKAVALNPKGMSPNYQLALVYKAQGENEKALRQWRTVAALPATDAEDEAAKKEAAKALGR